MAPSSADETLGIKHKEFNKLVQNAIANKTILDEKTFVANNRDLDNLMKIDIASHNKDIDYIISVLKSDDMLYVSRAIKQSPWLVDDEYSHIINPDYLNDHLFPQMIVKASIKLMKHIRHYLKTESRVEQFYNNEKNLKTAAKWLSRCSVPFIENNIGKQMQNISNLEFKRLCARSITVFEAAMKNYTDSRKLKAASFLLHTHADKYLDVFMKTHRYSRPTFGPSVTELIMKKTPDRIKNNFLEYVNFIDVPTFINFIKREDIKDFLYKLASEDDECNEYSCSYIFTFNTIKQFVNRMPKEEQFEFVKKVFFDRERIIKLDDETLLRGTEMFAIKKICSAVSPGISVYHWYIFASFDIAFEELKKLIQSTTDIHEKYSILRVLSECAGTNTKDLLTLLTYYFKNNLNDEVKQKRQFVYHLLTQTAMYKYDEETWNSFMNIIKNLEVYTENTHNDQEYINVVILYNILHDKPVPESIDNKFTFNSLKNYKENLNNDEKHKVFEYLFTYMSKKIADHNIKTEDEFNNATHMLSQLLDVLLDWDKELADYPLALNKIRDLIQIRKINGWNINLSSFYNKKKSWRRLMFEESVVLYPTQKVCVNALKHDPGLLVRYESNVEEISRDDKICLKQLLRKLRIYWPESLAENWTKSYIGRLDVLGGLKALIRGLCTLLPQEQLFDIIIKKYAPLQPKIDWNNTNELTLGLQRSIAKNMHIARPQPTADSVLLYAKGDFLQYALPSLLAIYYNIGRLRSQEDIPKLLNSPVSLQKHGLRFAFLKLKHEDLKYHLSNVWKTSKNISIRAVSFVLLFDLLCKEKDDKRAEELWEILEVFLDNLSFKEDKKIYEKLPKVHELPEKIQPKFLVKSYKFLKSLVPHITIDKRKYECYVEQLAIYSRNLIKVICPDFVVEIISEYLEAEFFKADANFLNNGYVSVVSSYLLCANDEETQISKYKKILEPLTKRALDRWNEMYNDKYFIRSHFQQIIDHLAKDLTDYVIENEWIIPTKMFNEILNQLNILTVPYNYVMLRMWKLTVKKAEIIEKNDKRSNWHEHPEIASEFGKYCLEVLKEDAKSYFNGVYVLYAKVLNMITKDINSDVVHLYIYESILSDQDFIQAYLLIVRLLENNRYCYCNDEYKTKKNEVLKILQEHPSVEVKMHYFNKFQNEDDGGSLRF